MEHELKAVNRGYDKDDAVCFSESALPLLQKAQMEIKWLLNRGYKIHPVIEMVGNHYQFSIRQRNALQRATASDADLINRLSRCLPLNSAKNRTIYIDGFNLIITLEVALSKSTVILCSDGTVRDIAGLRGTYRIIDKTDMALNIIGKEFKNLGISKAVFYLESAVSNSGRLKSFILEHAEKWNQPINVELVPNADPILSKSERVVTSDSIVLGKCTSWFNLGRKIIEDYIPDFKFIDLSCKK